MNLKTVFFFAPKYITKIRFLQKQYSAYSLATELSIIITKQILLLGI